MVECWEVSWWKIVGREEMGAQREGTAHAIYQNIHTGDLLPSNKLPFGACLDANDHLPGESGMDMPVGYDGKSIVCVTPITSPAEEGRKSWWYIDSRASNCDMKTDDAHRCWVRHGSVGERLHVDKKGLTCGAGAGSIQCAGWHGFLDNNKLTLSRA